MSDSRSDASSNITSQTGQFSSSTLPSNGTSTLATNVATLYKAASTSQEQGSHIAGTVVALVLILISIAAIIVFGYMYLRRKRKLSTILSCWRPITRSRQSSTSGSRRALAELDDIDTTVRSRQPGDNTDDMFTIEDFDDNPDPQGRQEYFYDEVFGQSQFEDETTNNAMRYLYSDHSTLNQEEIFNTDNERQGI